MLLGLGLNANRGFKDFNQARKGEFLDFRAGLILLLSNLPEDLGIHVPLVLKNGITIILLLAFEVTGALTS